MKIFFSFILFSIISIQWCFTQAMPVYKYELKNWEYRMAGDSIWKKAKVPGTIIDNFIDLSDITNPLHPYYGDNEKIYQWVGENDWEFRTSMEIDKNLLAQGYTYTLTFECIDLFADIFINDIRVDWDGKNAFRPLEFSDLTKQHLHVRLYFHSTTDSVLKMMKKDSITYPGGERVYARTPQYQFGWDWGPKFVNMGIRKPVTLEMNPSKYVSIYGLRFDPWKVEKKNGFVAVFLDGKTNYDSLEWHLKVFLNGDSIDGFDGKWHTYLDGAYLYYLDNPKLWWPNGYGESNYYEFDVRFTLPGDTNTLAKKHFYYAIADIDLEQKKDKYGETFTFLVNGKKIFAKGANYIPGDSFHPEKNTKELIKLARNANMNMIRVWGGGTYPDDEFYIECLKKGIMIWQDYMFACAMYPANDEFLYSIEDEAYYQTERLNDYTNIAVWCGNNENDEGWKNWGWQKQMNISPGDSVVIWKSYLNIFNDKLKHANDTSKGAYILSSPKHGWGRKESMTEGDSHYWGVWWGLEPLGKYKEKVPRFMSEFGMQGMPELSTLKKVIPDSAMNFNSPKFKNHQKHPTGYQTIDHYLNECLVTPDNMEDYAYATQVLQAYALTIAIEAQRRSMPYCMGSLIWQLNDCWPVTSWSLIDSELKNKIAYWEVKKAFEPIHISINEGSKEIQIILINDLQSNINGILRMEICDFYGNNLWNQKKSIRIAKNKTTDAYRFSKKILKNFDLNEIYFHATLESNEKLSETFFHFVKPNQLKLPPATFTVSISEKYNNITVKSNVYAPYSKAEGFYFGTLEAEKERDFWIYEDDKADIILFNPKKVKCLNQLLN